MTQQETRSGRVLLRTGAATAALGVVAALVQTGINPSYPDDPSEANLHEYHVYDTETFQAWADRFGTVINR